MSIRLGYLVPEFPGQTHIFFWREHQVLMELGIEINWLSTRLPVRKLVTHDWAEKAIEQTSYLAPLKRQDLFGIASVMLKAGPRKWLQAAETIADSKDTTLFQKLRLFAMIFMSCKLVYISRQKGWDHLHVHSCGDGANLAMFASILGGLPYSLTLHGPLIENYGPNQEQKWKYAAFGIVVSKKLLQVVQERLAGYLPEQLMFAPMGVDTVKIQRRFPYAPWQEVTQEAEAMPCQIFACGRLNPVKGHQYLLQTIATLRNWGFDARLQIAGEDEQGGAGYRETLESLIQEMELSHAVELLGAVSEEHIRQALERSHVFALASLNEGIPVAVMEAMAMEVPVVVNDVGGNGELIDNGVDGILLQPKQPEMMAEAIAKVLRNPELALQLSQASRRKIVEQFHHHRSAKELVYNLEKIAAVPDARAFP